MNPAVKRSIPAGEPSAPLSRSSPQHGDVVVTREIQSMTGEIQSVTREIQSRTHYTVRQLPGIVQFSAAVRDEAVQLARRFGRTHAVDVWYTDGDTYRLLEAYRPRTSARGPDHQTSR